MARWQWFLRQLGRRLWLRSALFAAAGVATALLAIVVGRYIPADLPASIGADAVDRILNILASSMLAVTTFSMSVVVAAYAGAGSNVTPRATRLLLEDSSTQNMLATFVGSFLFSLVGIIALSTGVYGERGRVVLFVVTLAVVALIVVTLLRWIDYISRFGRFGETVDRVEQATISAVRERMRQPFLGGVEHPGDATFPAGERAVASDRVGYVQHVDMAALSALAERYQCRIVLEVLPGTLAHPGRALCRLAGGQWPADAEESAAVDERFRSAFSLGTDRSYDQDPRFGVSVMAEIASRALSVAINDSGTAIDVIGRGVRILSQWRRSPGDDAPVEVQHPRVVVPPIRTEELFVDFFRLIARDGAHLVEVQIRLQKALLALAQIDPQRFGTACVRHSAEALELAERALVLERDKAALRELAGQVTAVAAVRSG